MLHAANVSEQTKAVLDRLGSAKQFLKMIMELGVIASEVGPQSSCYHAQGGLKSTFKAHPIAKAVFGCVNIVYEVSMPKQDIH
jgi:hypothetical protein